MSEDKAERPKEKSRKPKRWHVDPDDDGSVSLYPADPEDVLRALLDTPPD